MPLPFVWTTKVKARASCCRSMKYLLQDEFDKIHGCVIVVIEHDVPHAWTFCLYLFFFEEIESRFPDGSNSVWILLFDTGLLSVLTISIPIHPLFASKAAASAAPSPIPAS